jgi:hypothetical protein
MQCGEAMECEAVAMKLIIAGSFKEGDTKQFKVGVGYRAAVRAMRNGRQDLFRTGRFLTGIRRFAREDAGAAWSIPWTDDVIRSENFDTRQMRNSRIAKLDASLKIGRRRFKSLDEIVHRCIGFQNECDRNCLRSGFKRQPDLQRLWPAAAAICPARCSRCSSTPRTTSPRRQPD